MRRFSKETWLRHPGQQGNVLICTAFLLPVLFFLGGITVDFGGAYLAKSTLQNAADAAALAGGHEYLDSGRNVRSTKDSAKRSAQTNYSRTEYGHTAKLKEVRSSESFPDGAASIHIDTDAHDDYVDVTVRDNGTGIENMDATLTIAARSCAGCSCGCCAAYSAKLVPMFCASYQPRRRILFMLVCGVKSNSASLHGWKRSFAG